MRSIRFFVVLFAVHLVSISPGSAFGYSGKDAVNQLDAIYETWKKIDSKNKTAQNRNEFGLEKKKVRIHLSDFFGRLERVNDEDAFSAEEVASIYWGLSHLSDHFSIIRTRMATGVTRVVDGRLFEDPNISLTDLATYIHAMGKIQIQPQVEIMNRWFEAATKALRREAPSSKEINRLAQMIWGLARFAAFSQPAYDSHLAQKFVDAWFERILSHKWISGDALPLIGWALSVIDSDGGGMIPWEKSKKVIFSVPNLGISAHTKNNLHIHQAFLVLQYSRLVKKDPEVEQMRSHRVQKIQSTVSSILSNCKESEVTVSRFQKSVFEVIQSVLAQKENEMDSEEEDEDFEWQRAPQSKRFRPQYRVKEESVCASAGTWVDAAVYLNEGKGKPTQKIVVQSDGPYHELYEVNDGGYRPVLRSKDKLTDQLILASGATIKRVDYKDWFNSKRELLPLKDREKLIRDLLFPTE